MSALALGWLLLAGSPSTALIHEAPAPAALDESLTRAIEELQTRCYECHADKNVKGGLRLDDVMGWRENVDTDSPEDSELLYRMQLPADDGDAMPPKGARVSAESIKRIQRWIEEGAAEAPVQERIDEALSRSIRRVEMVDSTAMASGAVIEPVRAFGGGKSGLVRVSWSHSPTVPTKEQIALISPVASGMVELSVAGTQITDELLTKLPMLPALRRAHLERTNLTDAGVATLIERAPGLRYLNVHSTAVSANLHEIVSGLEGLEELVTFNTAADVTERAAPFAALRGQQPRRILAIGANKGQVFLLREAGLGSHDFIWERSPTDPSASCGVIQWLGDTPRREAPGSTALSDGHGRILMQDGPGHLIEVETRTNEIVWQRRIGGRVLGFHRNRDTGATLILASSGGDSSYLVDVDAAGVARTRPVAEFPALELTNERHAQTLSSGTTVQLQPHRPAAAAAPGEPPEEGRPRLPQLVERDAKGKAFWTFQDHRRFQKGLVSAQVIERTPPRSAQLTPRNQ